MDIHRMEFRFKDFSGYSERDKERHNFPISSLEYKVLKRLTEKKLRPDQIHRFVVNEGSSTDVAEDYRLFDFSYNDDDTVDIRTGGFVGVLQAQVELESAITGLMDKYEVKIEIGSRFDDDRRQFFLQYMLARASGVVLLDDAPPVAPDSIFELLLLYVYKQQLEEAYRQGLFKAYRRFEHNHSHVKGTIDIAQHIKHNTPFQGKVAYSTREHTYDNDILHLILHAYNKLLAKYPEHTRYYILEGSVLSGQAIRAVKEVSIGFAASQPSQTAARCRTRIAHPYFQRYEPLRITCLQILADLGVSLFDGDGERIKGVLFYVPRLWEQFLMGCFTDFQVDEQLESHIFIPADGKQEGSRIKPDFVFYKDRNQNPYVVLDAKYKPKWAAASRGNAASFELVKDDYLQVVNYMTSFRAAKCGVVFPVQEPNLPEMIREFQISTVEQEKHFYTLAMPVPASRLDEDFNDWKERVDNGIAALVVQMKAKILSW